MKRLMTGGLVALLMAAMLPATALAGLPNPMTFDLTGLTATFGDAPVDVSSFAVSGGSTSPVTFDSTTASVCTTGGTNGELVTILHAGDCGITASQLGDGTFDDATPVPQTFTIGQATPSCTITGYTVAYSAGSHTASGTCVGLDGITPLAGLSKAGTTHTNAGTYNNDPWTFTDASGDYANASGTVDDAITPIDPTCSISGYSVAFDNTTHTASGNCTGIASVSLAGGLDKSGTSHKDAGTYNGDAWSFSDGAGNYNDKSGTVNDAITAIAPDCSSIAAYNVPYDGNPHAAAGNCLGVGGASLSALVDKTGTTHTNVGNYPNDPWTFHDPAGNYTNANGTVHSHISKVNATCTITGYNLPYSGTSHTATGSCIGVDSSVLAGLVLTGTTHTNAGTYNLDPWTFTDVTGNYNNTSGTVSDAITRIAQTLSFDISGVSKTYGNAPFSLTPFTTPGASTSPVTYASQTPTFCSVSGSTLTILKAGACSIKASQAADTNYTAALDVTSGFTVAQASQTLGFNITGANKTYGAIPFGLGAFTTPGASSSAVTYSSSTTLPVCTVAGATLTIHKAGLCTVTAAQAGDTNYLAATSVTSSFTVAKADADCSSISAYSVTYDAAAHTATGQCLAVDGVTPLAGLDLTATTHTVPGTYNLDPWTFTDGTGNYNNTSDTVNDAIAKAAPSCSVANYTVTYDGSAHVATGSCTGVGGAALVGLDLSGTTHTNAGTYATDPWTFTDVTGNYQNANGTVADSIGQAAADCAVTLYSVTYDASPHTATGVCLALDGVTPLDGLDLSGTTHTNAGAYDTDPWTFTDAAGNYAPGSGTVSDAIAQALNTITFTTTPTLPANLGDKYTVDATAASGGAVTFSIDTAATGVCSMLSATQVQFVGRGACLVDGDSPATLNYLAGTGQQSIPVSDIAPTCSEPAAVTVIMNVAQSGTPSCTDAEGDIPLTFVVDTQGTLGTAAFNGAQWTYTPTANQVGADSFTFKAQDTLSAFSAPVTVSVTIVNSSVRARNDFPTVRSITPTSINVLTNDLAGYNSSAPTVNQDPGQPLTITAVSKASLGTVTTDGHTVTYDPNGCAYGSDLFTYIATDGLTSSTASVAVNVAKPGQGGFSKTPVTNTPTVAFVAGSKMGSTVPVKVGWCGLTATTKRIYKVIQSSNGGASYPTTVYASTTVTSAMRSLVVGANYAWRVRTMDGAGRTSAYVGSLTSKVTRFQNTSALIVFSAGWATSKSASMSAGSEAVASSNSATATLALPAGTRAFAIVSSKATNRGSFQVWVDGVLAAVVSEKASSTAYQILVSARTVTSTASHTIVIRPVGNGRIDLDAILTLQ